MTDFNPIHMWHLLTRLGEAQILLPTVVIAAVMMFRSPEARPLAMYWLALLGVATLVTAASKIAFIGWGFGWARLDFTGISGHAMFASAVCPVLLATLAAKAPHVVRHLAIITGVSLAIFIGTSRVVIGAHSISEVLAGLLVGGSVSAAVLARVRLPPIGMISPTIIPVIVLWLVVMPLHAPASPAHSLITSISLSLSGRAEPYTRCEMRRDAVPVGDDRGPPGTKVLLAGGNSL